MKSIRFEGVNTIVGKDQPEYLPLYMQDRKNPEGEVVACFELTDEEVAEIVKNKKLYYSQWTFGNLFQPMKITTKLEDI